MITMIGRTVRRLFGPYEVTVADLYRAAFVDLNFVADTLRGWCGAESILEVGCGEGQLTEHIAYWFPNATIIGIDIIARVGRLFRGDRSRVSFLSRSIDEFVASNHGKFELVVVCDVLHHVPERQRAAFLLNCSQALKPDGRMALKDWVKTASIIHGLAVLSDRLITGDRVSFVTAAQLMSLVEDLYGMRAIERTIAIPPWANNLMVLVRP